MSNKSRDSPNGMKYGNLIPVARLEVIAASGIKKPVARFTLGSGNLDKENKDWNSFNLKLTLR